MEIEAGYYSFRATCTKAGELQSMYSRTYYCNDFKDIKICQADFIQQLSESEWKNIKITHITPEEDLNSIYNYLF